MSVNAKNFRYELPKKAIKTTCPQCGNRHRKTLSRYVNILTDEVLPEQYGRCDRESNCGYHLSPYHKTATGQSYADNVYQQIEQYSTLFTRQAIKPRIIQQNKPNIIYTIPDEVFQQSLSHYERNQFARLLDQQFGQSVATQLLQRFQIGTSAHWPGACVFWYTDEQGRKRGGQIKLFGPDWHTVKYIDREGNKRSKTSWVHSALKRRLEKAGTPVPDWLSEYEEKADRSPCLFGLPQLLTTPVDQPVAIVEAPKTAVICTHHMPDFIWLAVGALSYLNSDRLAPLKNRKIELFPDLSRDGSAFNHWNRVADKLNSQGFKITISSYLEDNASDEKKAAGWDLADFLLQQ